MKKIIFLDLDGVLNISAGKKVTAIHSLNHFEKHLIDNFNIAISNLNEISIVMSSSWRSDYEDALLVLKECGFKHIDKFIGRTKFDKNVVSYRGKEIKDWLSENNFKGKYLCIDDNIQDIEEVIEKKYCLKINPEIGFEKNNIDFVKKYFN